MKLRSLEEEAEAEAAGALEGGGAFESLRKRLPPAAPVAVPPPPRTNICDASPATSMNDSSIPVFFVSRWKERKKEVRVEREEKTRLAIATKGFPPLLCLSAHSHDHFIRTGTRR